MVSGVRRSLDACGMLRHLAMTLLLSLTTGSIRSLLDPKADPPRTLHDAPSYACGEFGLRGLSVEADMLAGWSVADLELMRNRADQAGCPCLVLIDRTPLLVAEAVEDTRTDAAARLGRLAQGASRLGCNSVAVEIAVPTGDEDALERAIDTMQGVMTAVERLELNLLLAPSSGMTASAEGLSDLIKRVGGFRIGALPTYGDPVSSDDPIAQMRHLAPYAGAVHVRVEGFNKKGAHTGLDLAAGVAAAKAVGYQSNIAIDYVGASPAKDLPRAVEVLQAAVEAEG